MFLVWESSMDHKQTNKNQDLPWEMRGDESEISGWVQWLSLQVPPAILGSTSVPIS